MFRKGFSRSEGRVAGFLQTSTSFLGKDSGTSILEREQTLIQGTEVKDTLKESRTVLSNMVVV